MFRRLPLFALPLGEVAAVAAMAAALFLPWFVFSNPGPILAAPPAWPTMSFMEWNPHVFGITNTKLLAGLALYISVGAGLLRILVRRGWTLLPLALGFLIAPLGSIAALGEMDSALVLVPAGSTVAPGIGMGLFGVAGAVGFMLAVADWRQSRRRRQQEAI